ncbi:MnhB domain-containing protein [Pontibacter silvestris]|uniref:MnhB domain-containing protein n=1 Tax=Pontibacter silvestris TaxID=2305183 RepID=A0ABW4WZ55_9BACT|nr:MnhB domain-containing protein [Pontibacter silvestris]MCC9135321.1 cation:proton antiporter [Pontibacter silvestris]
MKTIILSTAIRLLTPLFQVFSIYILLRGHNHPGGGFIGGLIGAIAFVFDTLANGHESTEKTFFTLKVYQQPRKSGISYLQHYLQFIRMNIQRKKEAGQLDVQQQYCIQLRPVYLMALGLFIATISGTISLLLQQPFMTSQWPEFHIPVLGSPGTPLLFDLGVYLLVMGIILKIVFTLAKE